MRFRVPTSIARHAAEEPDELPPPHRAWGLNDGQLATTAPATHEPAFERLRDSLETTEAAHLFRVLGGRPLTHDEWSQLAGHAERWLGRFGHTRRAPDVFLPILGAPGMALPGWSRIVDHALAWMFDRPASTVHMVFFDVLARREGVLEEVTRDRVVRLWFHLLRRPGLEWFVRASRRAITVLASPTVHAADVACAIDATAPDAAVYPSKDGEGEGDVPRSAGELVAWIRSRVRHTTADEAPQLRRAFALLQSLSGHREVFHAAAVLPLLLPVLARTGEADLIHDGEVLAAVLAGHPLLTPAMRRRFVAECRKRLPLWPDPRRARSFFDALEDFLPGV